MNNTGINFTNRDWDILYDIVDDDYFETHDAEMIYEALEKNILHNRPFSDYLKRYVYRVSQSEEAFEEITDDEYYRMIRDSFSDTYTPHSLFPSAGSVSSRIRKWLQQQTVRREVVLILGFGLRMSENDVNEMLKKGIREQGLNAKDPVEVICLYCYRFGYPHARFRDLYRQYKELTPNPTDLHELYNEATANLRDTVYGIRDDASLLHVLARLKSLEGQTVISKTLWDNFTNLYREAAKVIAQIKNENEEEKAEGEMQKVYTYEDVTPADFENVLLAAAPKSQSNNKTAFKNSTLFHAFAGHSFSRQHFRDLLNQKVPVDRFDLITLSFIVYARMYELDPKERLFQFQEYTNRILEDCYLEELYSPNPYEAFIMMCLLTEDPICTYTDVLEMSFQNHTV